MYISKEALRPISLSPLNMEVSVTFRHFCGIYTTHFYLLYMKKKPQKIMLKKKKHPKILCIHVQILN